MRRTAQLAGAAGMIAALGLAGAPLAYAQAACAPGSTYSDYAGRCLPANEVADRGGAEPAGGGSGSGASTLPFTGGELVLVALGGAVAVAGGTALVVAARRRAVPGPAAPTGSSA